MSDQPLAAEDLAAEIARFRERRTTVIQLLDEGKRRDDSPDPHVRVALDEVTKALLAEQKTLTDRLLTGLRTLVQTITGQVAIALGLDAQAQDGYIQGTLKIVAYALQEEQRKHGIRATVDPEVEIRELGRTVDAQDKLLRWIKQAKAR